MRFASDVWCRTSTRMADSGVIGGLSRASRCVRSVLPRNSETLMLSTVRIVRRRFLNVFRRMSGRNFIFFLGTGQYTPLHTACRVELFHVTCRCSCTFESPDCCCLGGSPLEPIRNELPQGTRSTV